MQYGSDDDSDLRRKKLLIHQENKAARSMVSKSGRTENLENRSCKQICFLPF